MRQSVLFTKTRREAPKDEVAKNAQLLIRAGFVHKEMAGVYSFLPLGLTTLQNIITIIREEMNAIGGQEVFLSTLQDSEAWKQTDRWSDEAVDVWFKTLLKNKTELGLAPTHEEPLTQVMRDHVASYKDLPRYVYQFQNKFRNETRAKSGVMRSREFLMKDLYSFSKDEAEFRTFYEACAKAYERIFTRVGIGEKTYRTFASGGSFSKFSDEFQTVCDAGEDTIYIHEGKRIAVNKEVYTDDVLQELGLSKEELIEAKSIEVGNIFPLSTRFSVPLGLLYKDETGKEHPVVMGSYGIGPARLMGTIVELLADEKGMVWPESVAPYTYHLLNLGTEDASLTSTADELYQALMQKGKTVLYDDRAVRAGEKFADSELMGMPWRITVGKETAASGKYELQNRKTGEVTLVTQNELLAR